MTAAVSRWFQGSFVPLLAVLVGLIGTTVWLDSRAAAIADEPMVIAVDRQATTAPSDDIAEGMGVAAGEADIDDEADAHPAVLAARAARARGDLAAAAGLLEEALADDRARPQVLNELAVVHLAADRAADALVMLDEALALTPDDHRPHYNRGLALARLDRSDEALAAYDAALARRVNHFNSHYNRGTLLTRLGRHDAAAEALEKATTLAGGARKARALSTLGLVRARQGNEKAARRAYTRAIQFDPAAIAPRYNLLLLLIDDGRGRARREARQMLDQIKALRPDFAPAWFVEGRLASREGNDRAALEAYRAATTRDPGFWKARYNAGTVALRLGDVDGAARAFEQLAEQHPERPEIRFNLGRVAYRRDAYDAAAAHYRAAIELARGDYVEAETNLGLTLRALDRHDDALALFDGLIARHPEDAGLHRSRALLLMDLERLDAARDALRTASRLAPESVAAHYNRGRLEEQARRPAAAIAAYRDALALDPDHRRSLINLAAVLGRQKQHAEAEAALRRVLTTTPTDARARFNLGVVLGRQDRHAEAVEAYRAVLERDPEHLSARQNLGVALGRLDRREEAVTTLQDALVRDPADLETRYNLALQLRRADRMADAEAELRRCVRLDPTYAKAVESLASLLMRDKRSIEVLPLVEPRVAAGDATPVMRARLGRAYFAQERTAEARVQLELALEARPRSVEVLSALARVEAAGGEHARAAELIERALARRPGSALLQRRLTEYRRATARTN